MADQAKVDGDASFKAGDYQEAIKHYTAAIEQNAINGTLAKHVLLSNRSACYASLKKFDKALEDAKACCAANPAFAKGWSRKGAAMYGLGDLAGAAQAYKKAIEKDPNSAAKADLARIEAAMGSTGTSSSGWGGSSTSSSNTSRPAASSSSSSSGYNPPPTSGTGSASPIKGSHFAQLVILTVQILTIGCAVAFVAIRERALGRHMFNRAVFGGLAGFTMHTLLVHGMPSFSTVRLVYRALRGIAVPTELMSIQRVAMDLNTHNAFYCTLLLSSGPSLLLLIPIVLHSLVSVAAKATVVVSNVTALKALLHPVLKMVTSRTADICRYSAQTEVGIFFVLILQLATSQRNLILLVLYGQLLRVRFLVNQDSRNAWAIVGGRTDAVFLHARSPALVQTAYNKVKGYVGRMGIPEPPQR